jgi:MFS family permease
MLHTASYLIWLGAGDSYGAMVAFVIVMGFAYGGFVALSSAVVADAYGPRVLGAALGALYTAAAVGSLAGPPAAGAILDASGSYSTVVTALVIVSGIGAILLLWGVPMDAHGRIEPLPL